MVITGWIYKIEKTFVRLNCGENKPKYFDIFYSEPCEIEHLGANQYVTFKVRAISKELGGYYVAAFKLDYVVRPEKPKPPKKQKGDSGNWAAGR